MPQIGQDITITYQAVNTATQQPVSNDQAQHTLKVIAGAVESAVSNPITPLSNGTYAVLIPSTQNTNQFMTLTGISSTPNILIIPTRWENDMLPAVTAIPGSGGVAEFKDRLLRNLGNGDPDDDTTGVDVELTDADILTCLKETLELLNRYRPRDNRMAIPGVTPSVNRYPVSAPGLLEVIDVQFCSSQAAATVPDPFDPLINGVLGVNTWDSGGAADYMRYNMALKDAQIIYGTVPDWTYEVEVASDGTNTPCVYMTIPQGIPYAVMCEYSWGITPDDDPRTGVGQIERNMHDWVYDYGTAVAKIMVGRKRAKFGGVSTSDEGSSETDGAELIAAGREEKIALTQDLKSRRRPSRIHVG